MPSLKPNNRQVHFLQAPPGRERLGLSPPARFLGNQSVNLRKGRAREGMDSE